MMENLSFFDTHDTNVDLNIKIKSNLDVVKMDFMEVESLTWEELFDGFEHMWAITYSSGIDFVSKLVKKFETVQIIFGCENVMSYSMQEIMAYQTKALEKIQKTFANSKLNLLEKIENETLSLYVARTQLSHEKIYLLKSNDGRKRVVMGSANMSYSAFSGIQRENISYMESDRAFDWYMSCFEELKENSSDKITHKTVTMWNCAENIEELPISQTVKVKKAIVIEPVTQLNEEVKFAIDVSNLSKKFAAFIPKADKKGRITLSPEVIKTMRRNVDNAVVQERELRSEYPQLKVDVERKIVTLNDRELDLYPTKDDIKNDVNLFIEYMDGYNKFHGDVESMQIRYFEFANWFFVSPFMAIMRNMAIKYNHNLLPYPVFGLVYGQSKAGKTSFLETLLKMMIGQKTKISAPDFTRTNIEALKRKIEGAPIIVDDLTNTRFSSHAIETIKNDDFGVLENLLNYSAVVISANEDVKAVAPEVIRRTVICRVSAGLTNTELMKSNVVRRVQKNIGTAFYREYLSRMLEIVPELLEEMKDDDNQSGIDILEISSEVIVAIMRESYGGELPHYIKQVTLENYFSEKVTGSYAIKTIRKAWEINKKSFRIDKKNSELRYNTGDNWDANRIIKELPEDLQAHKSREWIIMDLDVACDFFDVNFKRGNFFRNK